MNNVEPECDLLFQNHVWVRLVAAGGENDGGAENQPSPKPRVGSKVFAEQFYAQP